MWALVVDEEKMTLRLQLLKIIKLASQPSFLSLMAFTVCLVVEEGKVLMFRVPEEKKVLGPVQVCWNGAMYDQLLT